MPPFGIDDGVRFTRGRIAVGSHPDDASIPNQNPSLEGGGGNRMHGRSAHQERVSFTAAGPGFEGFRAGARVLEGGGILFFLHSVGVCEGPRRSPVILPDGIPLRVASKENPAPGECHQAAGIGARRMPVEDGNRALLSPRQCPEAVFQPELNGGIPRAECEGGLGIHLAVADGLGRLRVEPTNHFVGIGIDGGNHPGQVHHGDVPGNRVDDLELVRPPIRKGGGHGALGGKFRRDLVALQNMLEGGPLDAEILANPQEHEDFIGPIGMALDVDVVPQDGGQGFKAHVPSKSRILALLTGSLGVIASRSEGPPVNRFDPHPAGGETLPTVVPIGLLDVFPQCELDSLLGPGDSEVGDALAGIVQLPDGGLSPHRIGGTVEGLSHRAAPRGCPENPHILGLNHVADAALGADGDRSLVDGGKGKVAVGVDDAGHDVPASGIHGWDRTQGMDVPTHAGDFPFFDEEVSLEGGNQVPTSDIFEVLQGVQGGSLEKNGSIEGFPGKAVGAGFDRPFGMTQGMLRFIIRA